MKVTAEGALTVQAAAKKLVEGVLAERRARGFKDHDFDVVVTRYLGAPAASVGNRLGISALDMVAASLPKEDRPKIAEELNEFQELVRWSTILGVEFNVLSSLLSLSSSEREKQISNSLQGKVQPDELGKLLDKLKELEKSLVKVDRMINKYFPDRPNQAIHMMLNEEIEHLIFDATDPKARQLDAKQKESVDLLQQMLKEQDNLNKSRISRKKGKVDEEALQLFMDVEPRREIRGLLVSWMFAEDGWNKLRDEKYLWTLLARISEIASENCSRDWAFVPGRTNVLDLVANTKWPDWLDDRETMTHSLNVCKKLCSFYNQGIASRIIFDPFKVNWDLVQELMADLDEKRVKMFKNCMETYTNTLKGFLKG